MDPTQTVTELVEQNIKLAFNSTMDPTQTRQGTDDHGSQVFFQFHDGSNSNPCVNIRRIKVFSLYQKAKKSVNVQSCKNPGRFTDFAFCKGQITFSMVATQTRLK